MKKVTAEILEKIEIMEKNSFLFPISWSKTIEMTNLEWSYRTYNSGSFGEKRYHNFEIYLGNKKILEINFRGNSIIVIQDLEEKRITLEKVKYYISEIFEELHSFKNHNEGKRVLRNKITDKKKLMETLKKEIEILKNQIIDIDKI